MSHDAAAPGETVNRIIDEAAASNARAGTDSRSTAWLVDAMDERSVRCKDRCS
jgi:hypothetical protein